MLTLSHVHQLFSVETCQAYLHALRWKDRPLQCPRCQSRDVDPWGLYHYRILLANPYLSSQWSYRRH